MISYCMNNQIQTKNIFAILEKNGFEKISGKIEEIVNFVKKWKVENT